MVFLVVIPFVQSDITRFNHTFETNISGITFYSIGSAETVIPTWSPNFNGSMEWVADSTDWGRAISDNITIQVNDTVEWTTVINFDPSEDSIAQQVFLCNGTLPADTNLNAIDNNTCLDFFDTKPIWDIFSWDCKGGGGSHYKWFGCFINSSADHTYITNVTMINSTNYVVEVFDITSGISNKTTFVTEGEDKWLAFGYRSSNAGDSWNLSILDYKMVSTSLLPPVYPPNITLYNVTNANGTFDLVENVSIVFDSGLWNWSISVVDNQTIDVIRVDFFNSSSGLLKSFSDLNVSTNGTLFNSSQVYNLSVFVNNTAGNISFESINFNVFFPVLPGNPAPNITLYNVTNDNGTFSLVQGTDIIYEPGLWNWSISVVDDGIVDVIRVDFFNSSSGLLKSFSDLNVSTNGTLFNSSQVYNLSVFVNDTLGNFSFESIDFNVLLPVAPVNVTEVAEGFSSTPQALYHSFLLAFWLALAIIVFTVKGRTGDTIQIFNIFQMVVGFVAGTSFVQFSFMVGFTVVFVAVGIFVGLNLHR